MILIWFGKRRLESRPIALLSARITTVWNFDGWNFDGLNHDRLLCSLNDSRLFGILTVGITTFCIIKQPSQNGDG